MASDLLRADENKTYQVDPAEMMKIIDNRALIPDSLKHNREELYEYVNNFKDDKTGKINYSGMIDNLN